MVDAERLARILSRVSADVTSLASTRTEGLESDDLSLCAVKYTFVTAIEGCMRAAQHVLSLEGLGVPESETYEGPPMSTGQACLRDGATRG